MSRSIPTTKIRRITATTATASIVVGGILAALSLAVYFEGSVVNQAAFAKEANGENANLVALAANTNQDYMEFCKGYTTAPSNVQQVNPIMENLHQMQHTP
jgi:uncharacterized protein (UPF0333 family)